MTGMLRLSGGGVCIVSGVPAAQLGAVKQQRGTEWYGKCFRVDDRLVPIQLEVLRTVLLIKPAHTVCDEPPFDPIFLKCHNLL